MSFTPPAVVSTPDPGALRYGLFTASAPMDMPDHGAAGGVIYDVDHCGTARLTIAECIAEAGTSDDKTFDQGVGQNEGDSFAVYAAIQCGRVGYTDAEYEAKARMALDAGEQGAVELALWTGLTGVGGSSLGIDGFNNSSPTALTPTLATSIASVVSELEEFAYLTSGYGYEAYIHAPVSVAAYAGAADLVVQDGSLKRTPYGSIWVFGGGYPGTSSTGSVPSGGTELYVTGKTNVWRNDVVIPDVPQTLDRETNQQYVLAERVYTATFDCLLGEAQFTFPTAA